MGRGRKAGDAREHVCRCGKAGDAPVYLGNTRADAKAETQINLSHALPAGPANCGSGVTGLTTGGGCALRRLGQVKCDGEPPWGLGCCPLFDGKKFSSVLRQGRENATPSDQADSMQPARTTKRMQPRLAAGVAFSLSSHQLKKENLPLDGFERFLL